jgi:molecular chaperone DnaK (HSP70)
MGKTIGIKLADGTFYPIIDSDAPGKKKLGLTTVRDDQTEVHIDLYGSDDPAMKTAEYIDTLQVDHLSPCPAGKLDISVSLAIDENDVLSADIFEPESGTRSSKHLPRISQLIITPPPLDFAIVTADPVPADTVAPVVNIPDFDFESAQEKDPLEDLLEEPVAAKPEEPEEPEEPVIDELEAFVEDESLPEETMLPVPPEETAPVEDQSGSDDEASLGDDDFSFLDEPVSMVGVDKAAKADEPETAEPVVLSDDDFSFLDDEVDTQPADEFTGKEEALAAAPVFVAPVMSGVETGLTANASTISTEETSSLSDLFDEVKTSEEENAKTRAMAEKPEKSSKIKTAVIVCSICAILCVGIFVALFFFAPDRSGEPAAWVETIVVVEPAPTAPEAVRIEPVVEQPVEEPSLKIEPEAIPVAPPPPEPVVPAPPPQPAKQEPVRYRIKWGDTLWDIAGAYYKNPWLYRVISSYNDIRNPDYIISGTYILIPPR